MADSDGRAEQYSIFSGYYDLAWAGFAEYCCDLIFAAEESAVRPFRRICDAACGTGVLLALLAGGGADQVAANKAGNGARAADGATADGARAADGRRSLCGFDVSASMLSKARERMPGASLRLADLRDPFPFNGPLDLVTCMHDSLNYLLDPDDLLGFFTRVRRVLAPDGVCICDINSPDLYMQQRGKHLDYLLLGQPVRQSLEYCAGEQLGITRFHFPEGCEEHIQRAYASDEVEDLLRRAGLYLTDSFEVEDEDEDLLVSNNPGSGGGSDEGAGSSSPDSFGNPGEPGSGKIVYVAVKA